METTTDLIAQFENIQQAVYALRWIIAIPFVVLGILGLWGWWNRVTV